MKGGTIMEQKTESKKLEIGEKYLSISLLGSIKLVAFKNKNKKSQTEPDFTGNGIAIWINTKKAQVEKDNSDALNL